MKPSWFGRARLRTRPVLALLVGLCASALAPALWAAGAGVAQPSVAVAVPVSASAAAAEASSAGAAPTLAAAFESAWARSSALPWAEGLRERARSEQTAAQSTWAAAPALELSQRSERWHGDLGARETEIGLGLALWRRGQRAALAAGAAGQARLAEAERAVARWQLAAQVRERAVAIEQARAALQLAQQQAQALHALYADVQRGVQARALARTDALAARAEWLAAQAQQQQAEGALAQARLDWQALTGWPDWAGASAPELAAALAAPASARDLPSGLAQVPDPAIASAPALLPTPAPGSLQTHPQLQRAQLRLELAQQQLDYAQRYGERAAPELRLGWREARAESGAAAERSLALSLRLPLGAPPRHGVQVAELEAALHVAAVELERLREQLQAEAEQAARAVRLAQTRLEASAEQAQLLHARAELLERALRLGELSLADGLRAHAAARAAASAQQQARLDLALAHARALQAQGILP